MSFGDFFFKLDGHAVSISLAVANKSILSASCAPRLHLSQSGNMYTGTVSVQIGSAWLTCVLPFLVSIEGNIMIWFLVMTGSHIWRNYVLLWTCMFLLDWWAFILFCAIRWLIPPICLLKASGHMARPVMLDGQNVATHVLHGHIINTYIFDRWPWIFRLLME